MSNIMIVLDGLQDITYPELNGKTPYDWGKGENFKKIEAACAKGTLATTPAGFEPDTQACILTLLGVHARDIPSGRSYIEALAVGVPVGFDDIVMRCNFVTVTPDGILDDPTCSAPEDIAKTLREAVASVPDNSITPVGSYKSLQVIKDGGIYAGSLKTYPPHNYAGKPFESLLPSGNELADSLAQMSRELLKKYAPYTVLNWAQAVPCALPSFSSLHRGMTGGMVTATHAPMGCAAAMSMACPEIPAATGDTDTDLAAKAEAALALAKTCDFVMVHIGGPDEATHRKNAREKAEFVRKLDTELIAPILNRCTGKTRIMITCDHVALCSTGGHTAEPVGFMLYEKGGTLSGELPEHDGKEAVEIMIKFK
ncbi:MAG: hypothetical protein FWG94_05500 [Oscillospiraceae bacterium]|nr:hypothetical protein [Oscillospiraceae bacterium]